MLSVLGNYLLNNNFATFVLLKMKHLVFLLFLLTSSVLFSQMDIVLQTGNSGTIRQLEFHSSKKLLLSADDQRVVIWDIQQRKQFSSIDFNQIITNSGFISESSLT